MTWIHLILGPAVPASHVLAVLLGGYLFGCLTTGYYLVRLRLDRDLRDEGSGSVGARNAGRVLGVPGFFITMIGDILKGITAVGVIQWFTNDARLAGLGMLAVTAGHIWPAQLGFRGGKGVATSLGALLVYDPHMTGLFLALFAGLFCVLRRTTLAGLLAFTFLPMAGLLLQPDPLRTIIISLLAAMILIAHRKNLVAEFTLLAARRHVHPKPHESLK
jgi:glycerol-3-phosphate acyltransferase PlsY